MFTGSNSKWTATLSTPRLISSGRYTVVAQVYYTVYSPSEHAQTALTTEHLRDVRPAHCGLLQPGPDQEQSHEVSRACQRASASSDCPLSDKCDLAKAAEQIFDKETFSV